MNRKWLDKVMARPLRIEYPDAVYHVMNRGKGRQKVFLREEDREEFLKLLEEIHRRWKVEIYAYCLMDNHYHICFRTPQGNLSRVMRHVDGVYTQRFNRAHKTDGSLFRGRYKALVIDEEEYLGAVVRYIHLNPVKAGLVKEPKDYEWSTHRVYVTRSQRVGWVHTQKLSESLGGGKGFDEYVKAGNDEEIEKFYKRGRLSPILGDEVFVEEVQDKVKGPGDEHVRDEGKILQPRIEKIIKCVATGYGVNKAQILKSVRGQENEARQVAMYLAYEVGWMKLQEIARAMGLGSYGAVGWNCAKVRERKDNEPGFKRRIERLIGDLK